jgi:hypothetical protein
MTREPIARPRLVRSQSTATLAALQSKPDVTPLMYGVALEKFHEPEGIHRRAAS